MGADEFSMNALGLPTTCIRVDVGDCLVVKEKVAVASSRCIWNFWAKRELEAGKRLELQTWNRCYSSHSGKLTNPHMQLPPRGMCLLTFDELRVMGVNLLIVSIFVWPRQKFAGGQPF